MAQHKFGTCLDEFAPRPEMREDFFGTFTPRNAPPCLGVEEKRRKDVTQKYGSGTPSLQSISRDPWGVPETYIGKSESVKTEQGVVKIPVDSTESYEKPFIPSVSVLNSVPYTGTRMRPLSDRYYK